MQQQMIAGMTMRSLTPPDVLAKGDAAAQAKFNNEMLDITQGALTVVSLLPGVGTPFAGLNAGISLLRGNKADAAMNAMAMLPGGGLAKGLKFGKSASAIASPIAKVLTKVAPKGIAALAKATKYGIKPYNQLRKLTAGTGLRAHHLIEKRFAGILGVDANKMEAIALTVEEHQVFTNLWKTLIPYGPHGTGSATRKQIMDAAREIYKDYPEILKALGL